MKIQIEKIIEALEESKENRQFYYEPLQNQLFSLLIDEENEEWEKRVLKSIPLPSSYEIADYHLMEEFIASQKKIHLYDIFNVIIKDKNPSSEFEKKIKDLELDNEWNLFRQKAFRKIAISWCKKNKIEYSENCKF